MTATRSLVAAIVGIDGSGKSTAFHGALGVLAARMRVVGIGSSVWSGGPNEPLHERLDIPLSRGTAAVGRWAKAVHWQRLYKYLKFFELAEQAQLCEYAASHDRPDVILTDGQPLINTAAWCAARFYKHELVDDDAELCHVLEYLAGDRSIPARSLPHYLRHSWQLVACNTLRLAQLKRPDIVFFLETSPAMAMARIRARGVPLQVHETEAFLTDLDRAYARVCRLVHERHGVALLRIPSGEMSQAAVVQTVADTAEEHAMDMHAGDTAGQSRPGSIAVIATTMSGSIQDQLKVPLLEPEFRARTARPVQVYAADSHPQAQALAHEVVAAGGRLLVSAGGGGTFNAVLEGAHLEGGVPPDLRLAFLRKGSADLIGKVLGIPDQLPAAVQAIVDGIESDHCIAADVLAVDAAVPGGAPRRRHLIGFGGFGIFGEVPRISETRLIKVYKGLLGTLFGDLGPFYVAIICSTLWWLSRHLTGHVRPSILVLDGNKLPSATWASVFVLNGDLGEEFPLGKSLLLSSGDFRVVALRYRGVYQTLRQMMACRSGAILDSPERYGAIVRTVRCLEVRPASRRPYMVNVDGLRMLTQGPVHISVSGQVRLVAGWKR